MDARRDEKGRIVVILMPDEARDIAKEYDRIENSHQPKLSLKQTTVYVSKFPTIKNLVKWIETVLSGMI